MSNYANTKATIAANVYENHLNQVTANMAKAAINAVVDTLIAGGFLYKGVATTGTNPGTPDANVFYIATAPGTYTNFGSLVVNDGEVAILKYNGSWTKEVTGAATAAEVSALGHEMELIENTEINGEAILVSGKGVYLSTIGEIKDITDTDKGVMRYKIPHGNFKITIPKCGNIYNSFYGFSVASKGAGSTIDSYVGPADSSTNKVFTFTNSTYDYLYICYVISSGSPEVLVEGIDGGKLLNNSVSAEKLADDVMTLDASIGIVKTIAGYQINRYSSRYTAETDRSVAIFPVLYGHKYRLYIPKTGGTASAIYGFLTDIDQTENIAISAEIGNYGGMTLEVTNSNQTYIYLAVTYNPTQPAPTCTDITNIKQVVAALEEKSKEISEISIDVPDNIFAVVGDTLQLYYESIFKVVDPFNYDIKVNCNIGAQYPRYFQITPTDTQVGDYPLQFIIKNYDGQTLGSKSVTLKVVDCVASPASNLNVLCVGASTTENGAWVGEMKKRLTTSAGTPTTSGGQTLFTPVGFSRSNITLVGRKEVNGAKFEAVGGFNFNSYINATTYRIRFNFTEENAPSVNLGDVYTDGTSQFTIEEINIPSGGAEYGYIGCSSPTNPSTAGLSLTKVSGTGDATLTASSYAVSGNPFVYNNQIDIEQYADDYCGGQIDVVFAYLFENGIITPYQTDFTSALSSMQSFINLFTAEFPSCKFGILLSQNKDARGGLGVDYGASQGNIFTYEYGMKVANHNLLTALQKYINDNSLSGSVFIVNNLNEFDYMNDYMQTEKIVNPRSAVKEIFGVNGVHPSTIGYYQIADSATRVFVAKFCQ